MLIRYKNKVVIPLITVEPCNDCFLSIVEPCHEVTYIKDCGCKRVTKVIKTCVEIVKIPPCSIDGCKATFDLSAVDNAVGNVVKSKLFCDGELVGCYTLHKVRFDCLCKV